MPKHATRRKAGRPSRTGPSPPPAAAAGDVGSDDPRAVRLVALALFVTSLAIRLLYWQATPDRAWGWSAAYKGDAPLWLEWARALQTGQPFELGLPIHTPGAAWVIARIWNGTQSGVATVRFVWSLFSALIPALLLLAVQRSFGVRVAAAAGTIAAGATSLLVLGNSLNNETPYLVLVLASFLFVEDLAASDRQPSHVRLGIWSALNALACLFRAEHVLYVLLALAVFGLRWRPRFSRLSVALACFALPLVPWHVHAWGAIQRFNMEPRNLAPAEEAAVGDVERQLSGLPWDPDALARREELPGFARRTAAAFVLATVSYRGGDRLRAADFAILEDAFGYFPRPLSRHPFVTSYGPLNFALANHAGALGGFDRTLLEQPPPLSGGAERYPPFLVSGLPPPQLTFFYPPHLQLYNDGYTIGHRWITAHPGDFARLAARKLRIFWSGAASGLAGWGFPAGPSGMRREVDMVAPEGAAASIWSLVIALAAAAGAVAGRQHPAVRLWVLFLATKIVIAVAFFGYARQGALAFPALALLIALAARPLLARTGRRALAVALALLVGIEALRLLSRPRVTMDGVSVGATDPLPPDEPRAVRVRIE